MRAQVHIHQQVRHDGDVDDDIYDDDVDVDDDDDDVNDDGDTC